MKIKSILFSMVAALSLAFTSCEQDNKGAVYMTDNQSASFLAKASKQEVLATDPVGYVTVVRGNTSAAATVNVSGTIKTAGVTGVSFPSSVSFEAGQKEAKLPVTLSPEVPAGKKIVIDFTIGEGDLSIGGIATHSLTISAMETWTQIGTGTYYYSLYMSGDDPGLPIYRCDSNPNKYKISHWFYDVDLIFYHYDDGRVVVEDCETGYVSSYGMIYIGDVVTYTGTTQYGQGSFDEATGVYSFAVLYYDLEDPNEPYVYTNGFEYFQLD